ncbi:hypothetical protein KCP70_07610 [Salmonella enterica subsp. enterica]|nr:hypothetical protein KCP70_07610 [Salmonella enterica subsp. enterica]
MVRHYYGGVIRGCCGDNAIHRPVVAGTPWRTCDVDETSGRMVNPVGNAFPLPFNAASGGIFGRKRKGAKLL